MIKTANNPYHPPPSSVAVYLFLVVQSFIFYLCGLDTYPIASVIQMYSATRMFLYPQYSVG